MTNLISGKEVLIALANGEDVEYYKREWMDVNQLSVGDLTALRSMYKFRLKPHTITINGIEVPAPFEPKEGERVWFICDDNELGYAKSESYGTHIKSFSGWWRTEDEIKQVVEALRQVFGKEMKDD